MTQQNSLIFHNADYLTLSSYLYQAAQVPSDETIQDPTGFSGVQTVPNRAQAGGCTIPCITSPQRQPAASCCAQPLH